MELRASGTVNQRQKMILPDNFHLAMKNADKIFNASQKTAKARKPKIIRGGENELSSRGRKVRLTIISELNRIPGN